MHKFLPAAVLAALFIFLGGASAANAQLSQYPLKFAVPFNFIVEDKLFPAGEYRIQRMPGIRDTATTLVLRGPSGRSIMVSTIRHEPSSARGYGDTALTVRRVNGHFYLAKIMIEGMYRGYEVPVSRSRRDLSARVITIRGKSSDRGGL